MIKFSRIITVACLVASVGIGSCQKDRLILPPEVVQDISVTNDRPSSRPNNLTIVTLLNQIAEVHWPELSDRVAEAELRYVENNKEVLLKIVDFQSPLVLNLLEDKIYDFYFKYITAEGTASKETLVRVAVKPFETKNILENLDYEIVPGGVKFIFAPTTKKVFKYTITYNTGAVLKTVEYEGADKAEILARGIIDNSNPTLFSVEVYDTELKHSTSKDVTLQAGDLPIKSIIPTLYYKVENNTVTLGWDNLDLQPIGVEVTYDQSSKKTYSGAQAKGSLNFTTTVIPQTIKIVMTDEDKNELTSTMQINTMSLIPKTAWPTPLVSSSDGGGGARAIIDGNVNTFWQTVTAPQSDPNIPGNGETGPYKSFNHWFVVDMQDAKMLGKVNLHKRFGFTNGFDRYKIEVSSDGQTFKELAKDIVFNATLEGFQGYVLERPTKCRYIRITLTSPRWECCDGFTHFGEFEAFAYPQ